MRRYLAVLLLVLVPIPLYAQDRVIGPADTTNGRTTILKASIANAKKVRWTIVNPPVDHNPEVSLDAEDLYFSSGYGGEYNFVISAVTVDEKGEVGLVVLRHTLKVGPPIGQPQQPAPPPANPGTPGSPGTPPPPTAPDIADWVAVTVKALVTADPQRAATAKMLAGGYRSVIIGGASLEPKEFAKSQETVNRGILDVRGVAKAWEAFLAALAQKLSTMNLQTTPDHLKVWPGIAAGLER